MTQTIDKDLIIFANRLANESRKILRNHFRKKIKIRYKSDQSPVTEADTKVEKKLRMLIQRKYPKHGIIGEEFENIQINAEYLLCLDPLDGTAAFITGKPLFGTLIGLLREKIPIFGIIEHPILGERWSGGINNPAKLNGKNTKVRKCKNISNAMLYATSPEMFEGKNKKSFQRLSTMAKKTQYGADCYAYGLLASGHIDLIAEAKMKPCDFLALVPVVRASGGIISDWDGKPLNINSGGCVLASGNSKIHNQALKIINGK